MSHAATTTLLTPQQLGFKVDDYLDQLFRDRSAAARAIDPIYHELIDEMRQFIKRGGKRMRPYLVYLAYAGYGGEDPEAILPVAASQELFHNFLLIHDDLIDRDLTRYGGPNIAGSYRQVLAAKANQQTAGHLADSVALLAGDINCGLAFNVIAESNFPDDRKLKALQRMGRMIFEIAGGEVLDVLLPLEPDQAVTKERLSKVMQYKTASYSFAAPLQLGALLAGASQSQLDELECLATPLGMAFQITDDLLGMFGDEQTLGKPVTSDLREGKRTILMQTAFSLCTPDQRLVLQRHFGNPQATEADRQEVIDILERCGAHAKTQALAASLTTEAGQSLERLKLHPAAKLALEDVMAFCVSRHK